MAKTIAPKVKKRKKRWIPLVAPESLNSRPLGECFTFEPEMVKGRYVTLNYMTLTGEPKKQHINISFRVVDVKDGKAITQVVRYFIVPSSLRRFVRKGKEKVDNSFVAKTSDDKYVRIKPLLVTNSKTHRSVITNLRTTTQKLLQNVIVTYPYTRLIEEVITYKLQKYLRDNLHKIYPIKICEIRDMTLLEAKPKNFTFTKEDISEIIKKSRAASKNAEVVKKPKKEEKQE